MYVFSKGIHLIVPRSTDSGRLMTFFADEGRLFFVILMGARTSVGTTDQRVDSPLSDVTDADRVFVLSNINTRLKLEKPLTYEHVIAERCGVRPLAVKRQPEGEQRDFMLHTSVYGGKLTDCVNGVTQFPGSASALASHCRCAVTGGTASRTLRCARSSCTRRR